MAEDQWGGPTGTPQMSGTQNKRKRSEDGDRQRILNRETQQDKAEELIDTLSSSGKCTPKQFINVLWMTNQTGLIHRLSVDGLKNKYQELHGADPVLPVRLQLAVVPQTSAQGKAGDKEPKDKILERILELERTLFTVEVFNDPVRYKKVRKVFKKHKALLRKALDGSIILLLTFLRQTDVDRFYHNHYRMGEGSLSQQLSHILISDELQDKVKGAQLIVRLQVKHEDYVRVRRRLGRGLDHTISVDNLLALPPPNRQVEPKKSSLRSLDLAVVGRDDPSCTEGRDHVSTLKFTVRQVQAVVRTGREKSGGQARQIQELQIQQGLMQTAREDTEAMVRHLSKEVTSRTEQKEKAEKILGEHKLEIQQLNKTNKSMAATIEELKAENTKMSNRLAGLNDEVREWREKYLQLTSQKVLSEQELQILQLQKTNKSMAATIEELLHEKRPTRRPGERSNREGDPSEQILKDSTSRRSVLLVSDEYCTSKGGISTINLNAARKLTAAGAKVYATVLEASEQNERDAERDGVRLLKPRFDPDSSVKPSLEWLTAYHSVHFPHIPSDVSCIVGHVDVTSRAARKIKEERFPHAKLAMFGHVAPEETEHYKSDEKALGVGRKEASIQDDIGKADVVFSVGPRIHRHYDRFLRLNHVRHHIFLPAPSKVFREANVTFEEVQVRKPERVILSIGRVRNVEMLKGHDLAAGAIDKAAQRLDHQYTLRLRVRGIDENDFQGSKRILEEKLRSGRVKPTLLPYGTQEEIRRDMEACHLVLMPSRAEPFGLVGLEAIAAGVPVLISEHSGLAELIKELSDRLGQPTFRHCIVRMKGDTATDDDVERWAEKIEDVLTNARSEFAEARAFREKLLASKYWEESHQTFLQACGITDIPSAQAEGGYAEAEDWSD
ncbi:uncharacterized protein LOC144887159 isoform X2 [Branchiostoma floridae x Branchiostoma japonicum]